MTLPDDPGQAHRDDPEDNRLATVADHGTGEPITVFRLWRTTVAASKQRSQDRRQRILAYPDLAKRLTEPPLRLKEPARWTGWIPPRTLAEEACGHCLNPTDNRCRSWGHTAPENTSPIRKQLVDIAAEALARETDE